MDQDVRWAKQQILAALREAPTRADTVDGIHDCWIHWGRPGALRVVTERALEELEQAREVERVQVGDRIVWRKARKG